MAGKREEQEPGAHPAGEVVPVPPIQTTPQKLVAEIRGPHSESYAVEHGCGSVVFRLFTTLVK